MSNKFNFTMNRLRAIKPTTKRAFYYDTAQPGLRIAVSSNGNKSFQFQCWSKTFKRPLSQTLGKIGTISIDDARKEASKLFADVKNGADIEALRQEQRDEPLFAVIFERYIENHAKVHKRTWEQDIQTYNKHLCKFARKIINQITPDKLKRWHKTIGEKSGKYAANRALDLLSSVFSNELPNKENPCRLVKKYKEQSRDRFLQPNELQLLFKSIKEEPNELMHDFFLLLLLTAARKSNVMAMKWNEIDIENTVWNIPPDKSKNQEGMRIPLVVSAIEILKHRKSESNDEYVFPSSKSKTGHMVSPKSAWKRIINRAGLQDIRLHDLRRTMGSWMAAGGASTLIIGKALGHLDASSTAVYSRLNIDPVRLAMEQAAEAMLDVLPE